MSQINIFYYNILLNCFLRGRANQFGIRLTMLLVVMCMNLQTFSQAPEIIWDQGYGGNDDDRVKDIILTPDGGYLMVGQTNSIDGDVIENNGLNDVFVLKVDSNGVLEWSNTYGGSDYDNGKAACLAHDGGYIIVADVESVDGDLTGNNGYADTWIFKLDELGNIAWQRNYGGAHNDTPESIIPTNDGGYIVAGSSQSNDGDVIGHHGASGNLDIWVAVFDLFGNLVWNMSYGSTSSDSAEDIVCTQDGNYVIAAKSNGYDGDIITGYGDYDAKLLKISPDGELIWVRTYGGSWPDYGTAVIEKQDGNMMVLADTQSDDGLVVGYHGITDVWVFETDTEGNFLWGNAFGSFGIENGTDLLCLNDNEFFITSTANYEGGDIEFIYDGTDQWIFAIDSMGDIIWQKTLGGTFDDSPHTAIKSNDEKIVITGYSNSTDFDVTPTYAYINIWTVKLGNCNTTYYRDFDEDGYGYLLADTIACSLPIGFVADSSDCNDANAAINPDAVELCNGIDDNCNTFIDEGLVTYTLYVDDDGDTYGDATSPIDTCVESVIGYVSNNSDCNDFNSGIYPGAEEICNYLDDDCDGEVDDNLAYTRQYQDADGDNYGNSHVDTLACLDIPGYITDSTDCNDLNPDIYPGAPELLNGMDDDCDGQSDEGLAIFDNNMSDIWLYPNPTNGFVMIRLLEYQDIDVSVKTIDGKLVSVLTQINTDQLLLDLSSEAAGVYLVTVASKTWVQVFQIAKN